ncbi:MAG: proline--tRNA ligase [Tissierellia bacterium]|nr:proline--tRNA ligase [Tissierellia bacterium]
MRLSKYYLPTLREVPADAEIASHQLMLRSGMIRRSASGIYSYLPLGLKVIQKVEQIVREEMNRAGALEILMSAIQPQEIWEESGRWDVYGPEMFKLQDRNGRGFCLGPTAEEYFTGLVKGEVSSYKQLPLNLYQIQTKYRDEKRPRFGVNRAREFSMKDAYSFDVSPEAMMEAYQVMYDAYIKIFDRLKLKYRIVQGDAGAMGGNSSHEFIALAETGEGVIVYTEDGSYAATDEKAEVVYSVEARDEAPLEKVHTPGAKTIEEVAAFLGVEKADTVKAIDLMVAGEPVLALIPGDRELNEIKLAAFLEVAEHEIAMMDEAQVLSMGSHPGFTGPVNLKGDVRIVLDRRVAEMKNFVTGANEADYHYLHTSYPRDFEGEVAEDLLMVEEGDTAPDGALLEFARGIEVGNIFQLGQKYSKSLHATFLDENGKEQFFWMGSYGVGVTRSVAAIVEQNHDEDGILWPLNLAPFPVVVTVVNTKKEEQTALGEAIYQKLLDAGVDVLLDDRNERAGVKFKDRDLIGIPLRISVGKKAGENIVEYSTRRKGENIELTAEEAVARVLRVLEAH